MRLIFKLKLINGGFGQVISCYCMPTSGMLV